MKSSPTQKIIAVLVLVFAGAAIVYAAESYRSNPSTTITVNEHTVCKNVINNGSLGRSYFIPTKTSAEWSSFRAADSYLTDISLSDCATCSDGIKNGTETGVDCGGPCAACVTYSYRWEMGCSAACQASCTCPTASICMKINNATGAYQTAVPKQDCYNAGMGPTEPPPGTAACVGGACGGGGGGCVLSNNKRIFYTSTFYNGNLGGLAGADAKCNTRASAAGISSGCGYKAWLSTGGGGVAGTNAKDRLTHATGKYVSVTGTVIANNWYDLVDGSINYVNVFSDENGIKPTDTTFGVYHTNTKSDGTATFNWDCNAWTGQTPVSPPWSGVGIARKTSSFPPDDWTNASVEPCSWGLQLLCIEQ